MAFMLAAMLVVARPARGQNVVHWRPVIAEASLRFGIPVPWIERVMLAESAGRTTLGGRPIVSRAGAMGPMQLMPGTWAVMRTMLGLGRDPFDPHDNIIAGTGYLRLMYDRFGYPGVFAAYNAGPGRYAAYLAGREQLPGETRAYVAIVSRSGTGPADAPGQPARNMLFAVRDREAAVSLDREQRLEPHVLFAVDRRERE
jgi:soluble lytic murein transglycosylase-like protein